MIIFFNMWPIALPYFLNNVYTYFAMCHGCCYCCQRRHRHCNLLLFGFIAYVYFFILFIYSFIMAAFYLLIWKQQQFASFESLKINISNGLENNLLDVRKSSERKICLKVKFSVNILFITILHNFMKHVIISIRNRKYLFSNSVTVLGGGYYLFLLIIT